MPTRSRNTNTDVTTVYTVQSGAGAPKDYTNVSIVNRKMMDGIDTPEFYAKKRRGELLPMTNFSYFETEGTSSSSPAGASKPGYTINVTGLRACQVADWIVDELDMIAIADELQSETHHFVNVAAAKIYGRGHDTLTFIAELHKVARMFRNAVRTLIALLRGKSIFQAWLEYRYGWRLLYYDIVEIQKVLSNLDDSRTRFSERVGHTLGSVTNRNTLTYEWSTQTGSLDVVDNYDVSLRGSVIADIGPPKFRFNPITTSWELVRFSFIVDWFIDIGSWLEALSFLYLAENHYAAGGIYITHTRKVVNHIATPKSPWTNVWGDWWSEVHSKYTRRTPQSVGHFPNPNINLDVFKVTDLIAIIFGGKPPQGRH